MKVICNKKSSECPTECVHGIPHAPIEDMILNDNSDYEIRYCHEVVTDCWHRPKIVWCKCEKAPNAEVQEKLLASCVKEATDEEV